MADDANINRTLYMDRVSTVCMAAFSHPQSEASFSPKGRVLSQYTVDDQPFTLYLDSLTTPEAVSTFKKMQAFGYWFIDGASEIVVTPDSPHRWLVLTLFTSVQGHPVLAGYCLLYLFSNPFQSPPHSLRLCQILVLPPFQKQGHSSRIFDCVYRTLMHTLPSQLLPDSYPAALDGATTGCAFAMYTVEDPCEDFTFVRDVYDCRLLLKVPAVKAALEGGEMTLGEDVMEDVRKEFGIIPAQTQKCFNILLHHGHKPEQAKAYRLYV